MNIRSNEKLYDHPNTEPLPLLDQIPSKVILLLQSCLRQPLTWSGTLQHTKAGRLTLTVNIFYLKFPYLVQMHPF